MSHLSYPKKGEEKKKHMSVKIRISYQSQEELDRILKLLKPAIKSFKTYDRAGEYKKAYIVINEK